MTLDLDAPVRDIDPKIAGRRVGLRQKGPPAWEVLRDSLGIETVRALLDHYPRRYIDRSQVATIKQVRVGQHATVIARVRRVTKRLTRRRQTMVTVTVYDGTGYLDLTFFNQPWTATMYREGQELAVSGVASLYRGRLQLQNQEVEILNADGDQVHTGRITPVHRATEGITTRTIRELAYRALEDINLVDDPLPADVVDPEGLAPYDWALRNIHFPETQEDLDRARDRLKFDELFTLELGVAFRKNRVASKESGVPQLDLHLLELFLKALPFELTAGQRKAIDEITSAMAEPHPMNLLLQGDVGSGKTVVSLAAAMVAVASGHQAAIMAPTEVLAGQHFRKVEELLAPIGAARFQRSPTAAAKSDAQGSLLEEPVPTEAPFTFALLTAAVTGRDRAAVLEAAADGRIDLLVGTHALVQEGVAFSDLSLAVVDEQHRFGVHQRMALKRKGVGPDVLIMTATPIPRTLALTYYGDLDVAVLDELPAGRQPIETRIARTELERASAYDLIRGEVAASRQAFVVCAAIDQENRLQVKAAETEAERLRAEVFRDPLRVEVLHGRMRPAEKDRRMEEFRAGRCDVLISTTVIEVGVDVPNATVMLVENAERFGLAQLHQLRGRIGRGEDRSWCVLFDESDPDNEEARQRLAAMARTTDGFLLADEDLKLRGEGTLFDVRQSGMPDLKLARLSEDLDQVKRARARAFAVIAEDPELNGHRELLRELESRFAGSIEWLFHS